MMIFQRVNDRASGTFQKDRGFSRSKFRLKFFAMQAAPIEFGFAEIGMTARAAMRCLHEKKCLLALREKVPEIPPPPQPAAMDTAARKDDIQPVAPKLSE